MGRVLLSTVFGLGGGMDGNSPNGELRELQSLQATQATAGGYPKYTTWLQLCGHLASSGLQLGHLV